MSLLKWTELAKSKTELGNKINYVHNLITQDKIGRETSQDSLKKVFEPVTSKLDDVVASNLYSRMPQRRRRPPKKGEVPNYGIDIEDEVENMGLDDLFGDYVPPQQEKQIVPKPPTYEESLEDVLEGKKEIYVDPEYFIQDPPYQEPPPPYYPTQEATQEPPPQEATQEATQEPPPESDEEEEINHTVDDEDEIRMILDDIDLPNYESIDASLDQNIMTKKRATMYLKNAIKKARKKKVNWCLKSQMPQKNTIRGKFQYLKNS